MSAAIEDVCIADASARTPLDEPSRRLQHELLVQVSRTFALTIPRLPADLVDVVGNAYLLCRIVDTIEDELETSDAARDRLYQDFNSCLRDCPRHHLTTRPMNGPVSDVPTLDAQISDPHDAGALPGGQAAQAFTQQIATLLPASAPSGERFLVEHIPDVLAITGSFTQQEQAVLRRCVEVMTRGMREFEVLGSNGMGLDTEQTLDRYCYHVAGCVGELLTELFCLHDTDIAAREEALMSLSRAFGSGLQLTNIIKDMWVDHARGVCWLPRDAFNNPEGDGLPALMQRARDGDSVAIREMDAGTRQLVARCRSDLDKAMQYVRTIPRTQRGLRVFCLWSIGLSVLTLRKIQRHSVAQRLGGTKVSRTSVKMTLVFSDASAGLAPVMRLFYRVACIGLPRRA